MAVSQRLRYEILRRDNHACRYCGATAPGVKLNVDHVIPVALGGSDAPTNLVTACAACNGGKTSSMPNATPVADVDQETFRRAAHLKNEAEQRRNVTFVHLYCTWRWSWERAGRLVTELDEDYFTLETHKLLDCGASATADLTEAAFLAGADNAIDISSYIGRMVRSASTPDPLEDHRFVACVDAINAWERAWDSVSDEGPPPGDAVCQFLNVVGETYDAGTGSATLLIAAESAGRAMSTDLRKHVAELASTGGAN
ncbi:HNH endonuclease [Streptomyces sp. NBC_01476]|uniref:HNH endonuclease n=1 Tax=Streptomyces sp. NBC_01476 TaxID=2903881 RepID=UPI002E320B03|nr:HNH endonuclease [Streptomyces sp. NBC_01476]